MIFQARILKRGRRGRGERRRGCVARRADAGAGPAGARRARMIKPGSAQPDPRHPEADQSAGRRRPGRGLLLPTGPLDAAPAVAGRRRRAADPRHPGRARAADGAAQFRRPTAAAVIAGPAVLRHPRRGVPGVRDPDHPGRRSRPPPSEMAPLAESIRSMDRRRTGAATAGRRRHARRGERLHDGHRPGQRRRQGRGRRGARRPAGLPDLGQWPDRRAGRLHRCVGRRRHRRRSPSSCSRPSSCCSC